MHRIVRKLLRAVANYDPDYYDMYEDPNETLFARLYLDRIVRHAEAVGIAPPARVLDAGCQAGRLAVPLASRGFAVTGVDTSGFALRRARAHARRAGVAATWRKGDVAQVLRHQPAAYELIICAEVVYLSPGYREILSALAQAVRPGGLVCVSHRTQFYYLIQALRQYDVDAAHAVVTRSEGPFRDSAYYDWQTEAELRALYAGLGLRWVVAYPIDRFAWLTGLNPSRLSPAEQQEWMGMELEASDGEAGYGRYLLVIAQRPG